LFEKYPVTRHMFPKLLVEPGNVHVGNHGAKVLRELNKLLNGGDHKALLTLLGNKHNIE
ncbi:hypothetical protein M9458_000797, partial [Cirrhinus mrigala]